MKAFFNRLKNDPRAKRFALIAAGAIGVLALLFIILAIFTPRETTWPVSDHASVLTMTIGLANEPDTLFPLAAYMPESRLILAAVYEPPLYAKQYIYRQGVLDSMPTLENGNTVLLGKPPKGDVGQDTRQISQTFVLRDDLRWADTGEPVTSADLAHAYQLAQNPEVEIAFPELAMQIASAQASGPYSVNMQLKPGIIPPLYNTYVYPPLPSKQLANVDPGSLSFGEPSRRPVGYGPYQVMEWVPAEQIVLQRNNYYFRRSESQPRVPYVVFKFMPDAKARVQAVADGQLDVALGLGYEVITDVLEAEQAGKIQAQFVPGQTWEMLAFNLDDPILKDIRVRQAIAYGTDRQSMVDKLLHGKVPVLNSWIPPDHPDYIGDAAIITYPYDPAKAKQLLDQAGWTMSGRFRAKDGQPLKLTMNATQGDALREAYLKMFKENMAAIGVDVTVELLPASQWYAQGGKLTQRQFQLGIFPWVAAPDPGSAELWTSTSIPTDTNGYHGQNYFGWHNADSDLIYKQLGQTLNRGARHSLYARQQALVAQELPGLPLFQHVVMVAANPKLTGLKLDPTDLITRNIYEWDIPLTTP